MKVENAAEDAGTVGTVAGGVTFEWLRQVRKWLEVASWMANEKDNQATFDSHLFYWWVGEETLHLVSSGGQKFRCRSCPLRCCYDI